MPCLFSDYRFETVYSSVDCGGIKPHFPPEGDHKVDLLYIKHQELVKFLR